MYSYGPAPPDVRLAGTSCLDITWTRDTSACKFRRIIDNRIKIAIRRDIASSTKAEVLEAARGFDVHNKATGSITTAIGKGRVLRGPQHPNPGTNTPAASR